MTENSGRARAGLVLTGLIMRRDRGHGKRSGGLSSQVVGAATIRRADVGRTLDVTRRRDRLRDHQQRRRGR